MWAPSVCCPGGMPYPKASLSLNLTLWCSSNREHSHLQITLLIPPPTAFKFGSCLLKQAVLQEHPMHQSPECLHTSINPPCDTLPIPPGSPTTQASSKTCQPALARRKCLNLVENLKGDTLSTGVPMNWARKTFPHRWVWERFNDNWSHWWGCVGEHLTGTVRDQRTPGRTCRHWCLFPKTSQRRALVGAHPPRMTNGLEPHRWHRCDTKGAKGQQESVLPCLHH